MVHAEFVTISNPLYYEQLKRKRQAENSVLQGAEKVFESKLTLNLLDL